MITDMKDAKLFSPIQIGNLTLKNRIAMAPMSMHLEAANGTIQKRLADVFTRRAEGGVGLVTIDAVTVDHKYWYIGKTTALDKDSLIPQFKAFADRIKGAGSTLFPQIIHPGPESICAFKGIKPLGPSPNTNANGHVSRSMKISEIKKVVKQYGQAARRAEEAGCGGIALHAAHAYMLPGAFLSPLRNHRMDEYGGTLENRARLILEIIEECRKNVSDGFPISLRVSGDERMRGGNTLMDMLHLAPMFEAAGVNMLEISGGVQYEGLENIIPCHNQPVGINVYEASEIKKVVNIPVFVVGKINDIHYGADIVERGLVDGITLGRPLLADPDLPKKALENRFDDITPCASCGGSCISQKSADETCGCHINPLVGKEYSYPFNPVTTPKKVLIIGAGPGGMYAAVTAAERGHDVTVWEKSAQIGGQLKIAVVSPGKQDLCKWLSHLNYRAKKANVKFEFKKEATLENVKEFAPDAVICATGAKPFIPPFIKGLTDYPVTTTHDILSRKVTIPKGTVCILGGGEVACETAELLLADARPHSFAETRSIGDVKVTMVEMMPLLMNGVCQPNRSLTLRSLEAHDVDVHVNTKVLEVTAHDVKIQNPDGSEEWMKGFDKIILGLGSRNYDPLSEDLKAFVPEVHVIGDAVRARQSSQAMHEGFEVAYNL
ncbi:MAG: FAD-dependent oxidoreductase [Hespellia sp.]|nr:FAD-dependent oxidoreductase [Hespellia sp.]